MSEEKKISCGLGTLPKTKRRGTAEECMEVNQVRYYGVEKIDKELLLKKNKILEKLQVKLATTNIEMRELYQEHKYEENTKKKEVLKKKLKKISEKFVELRDKVNELEKAQNKYKTDKEKKKSKK